MKSIINYARGEDPLNCGQSGEFDCGNGSLMRCLPLVFWLRKYYGNDFIENEQARTIIHNISSLTHAYPRCLVANGLYLSVAGEILRGKKSKKDAVKDGLFRAKNEYEKDSVFSKELAYFSRLFEDGFEYTSKDEISARGYVVDTLETAIWAFIGTDDYKSCILQAVNQGHDTDTTAAIAGGLAGLYYGIEDIPDSWKEQLLKRDYIYELCEKYTERLKED